MNNKTFKIKKLAVAILITAPIFGANAAIIELNLSAESSASVDTNLAVIDTDGPSSANVSSNASDSNSGSSFASANASGNTDGSFYSNTSGFDTYNSSATFLQSYNVTNDALSDQFFDFNFSIENGSLEVGCNGYGGDGYGFSDSEIIIEDEGYGCSGNNGSANASYEAEIRLNDVVIWDSMAELAFDGTTTSLTPDGDQGTILGTYFPFSNYYGWNAQSFTIDIGTFAANEEFTLDYEITLKTAGINGTSFAQFGDPNGFGQSGSPFTTSNVASVPEPTSLAIIAAGLGLMGLSRKRKNKVKH